MQQLIAFTTQVGEFKKLGIQLLAISPDQQADLAKAHQFAIDKKRFPFPLISAKSDSIFSRYRAYDDFEKMPLHAIAFIDSSNQLRWLDVSYQPFTDAKFVLDECKRLLQSSPEKVLSSRLSE
jgi:peroxiredoxin